MFVPAQLTSPALALVLLAPLATAQDVSTTGAAPDPNVVEAPAQTMQGWLGVSVDVGDESGLVLTEVTKGSGADRAGLSAGDRILAFDGRPITTFEELRAAVRGRPIGSRVVVSIARAVEVQLKAWQEGDPDRVLLGVYLTDDVSIGSTMPGYGAEQAGLLAGDRIVAVGGQPVQSKDEATAAVSARKPAEMLSIEIARDVQVRLGVRPGSTSIPVPVAPLGAPIPRPPIARTVPRATVASAGLDELRAELGELAAALRALREEVDVLRDEVDRLRGDRR